MHPLAQYVRHLSHRIAFQSLVYALEQCSQPFVITGTDKTEKNKYLEYVGMLLGTIFTLMSTQEPSFQDAFETWLEAGKYGYTVTASNGGVHAGRWSPTKTTQGDLLRLAEDIRRLLDGSEEVGEEAARVLYQELVVQNQHSVVKLIELYDSNFDAVLIRGATQYGKTGEALLLAWRAWWEGVLTGNTDVGKCATFLFVR